MSELYHYGVLGMKWGVRRTPEQLGHKPPEVHEDSRRARAKKASEMSDAELNNSVNRIRREQEYNSLTESGWAKARQSVQNTLTSSGGKIAAMVISAATTAVIAHYLTPVLKGEKTWAQIRSEGRTLRAAAAEARAAAASQRERET